MATTDFKFTLTTEQTPQEVFEAITNVRGWWSGIHSEEIHGGTEKLNDEFSFSAEGGAHYSKQKLVEVIPNKKVVWLVTDSKFSYVEKQDEWTGTKVIFEISEKGGKTQLVFTHEGLTPEIECYESCAPSWSEYLQDKLLTLINTGKSS
ncbi:SRPBCC family protein [Chitinophaga barathri]|uniref:SRPBCC domain-containing protein n=1 Tax=Chitinophaga barathri TaxID=1647451 RepID=A0A3N4M7X4_9BACT|nr:SRPBCC domain-containing protein [Chitinophaga barathri]RPD39471.1 SRPBCC domain-containing protein [Chitinophaga barathri]